MLFYITLTSTFFTQLRESGRVHYGKTVLEVFFLPVILSCGDKYCMLWLHRGRGKSNVSMNASVPWFGYLPSGG